MADINELKFVRVIDPQLFAVIPRYLFEQIKEIDDRAIDAIYESATAIMTVPVMNEKGVVVGYLNQMRMGEVTGVGVIGKNGLLLNARYGSRLMLGGVVTSAVLPEASYPGDEEPGCPPDCRICADVCPVNAIELGVYRKRIVQTGIGLKEAPV